MRMMAVLAVVAALAGCQTTTVDKNTSGQDRFIACSESRVWTRSKVGPSEDQDCRVTTPYGLVSGLEHMATMRGVHDMPRWTATVHYVEAGQGSNVVAQPATEALLAWTELKDQIVEAVPAGSMTAAGRTVDLFKVRFSQNREECLGFVGNGPYSGGGYANRIDGVVCHRPGPRQESQLRRQVANIVVR